MAKKKTDEETLAELPPEVAPVAVTEPTPEPEVTTLVPLAQFRPNDDAMNYHAKQAEIHLGELGCKTHLQKVVQLTDDGEIPVSTLYLVGQLL